MAETLRYEGKVDEIAVESGEDMEVKLNAKEVGIRLIGRPCLIYDNRDRILVVLTDGRNEDRTSDVILGTLEHTESGEPVFSPGFYVKRLVAAEIANDILAKHVVRI